MLLHTCGRLQKVPEGSSFWKVKMYSRKYRLYNGVHSPDMIRKQSRGNSDTIHSDNRL